MRGVGVFLKGDGKGNFEAIPSVFQDFSFPKRLSALSLIHLDKDESG